MEATQERTYTTQDKSTWGPGPWQDEPDKVQWVDEDTGLDCLAVRNNFGAWCGYVGVTEPHPWFGKSYHECLINCDEDVCWEHTPAGRVDVHGGLTFSDYCQERTRKDRGICYVPLDGNPKRIYWFGFDCSHYGDLDPAPKITAFPGGVYRTLLYVKNECRSLADRLADVQRWHESGADNA
jgi:hypothetical protein